MQIDKDKCIGCANCVSVCPMGAIYIGTDTLAEINQDECVECHTCYRGLSFEHLPSGPVRLLRGVLSFFRLRFQPEPDICPTEALVPDELTWPRTVRRAFSDPQVPHESTGMHGRGTEEVKTNDITGRVQQGEAGFVVEFGRPGVGAYFRDVDRATRVLATKNVAFEPNNPVTTLMSDMTQGRIQEDVLNEKVLSCIVEFKTVLGEVPEVLKTIEDLSRTVDTVVSVGVSTRCDSEGNDPLREILRGQSYDTWRAKVNLGMGRVTNPAAAEGDKA